MVPYQQLVPKDSLASDGIETIPLDVFNRATNRFVDNAELPVITHVYRATARANGDGGVSDTRGVSVSIARKKDLGGPDPEAIVDDPGKFFIELDLAFFALGESLTIRGVVEVGGKFYPWVKTALVVSTMPSGAGGTVADDPISVS